MRTSSQLEREKELLKKAPVDRLVSARANSCIRTGNEGTESIVMYKYILNAKRGWCATGFQARRLERVLNHGSGVRGWLNNELVSFGDKKQDIV